MITIYGKDNCTYCDQAKRLCEQKGVDFEYKSLGVHFERDEFISYMIKEHGVIVRTMPQIVHDGDYIGGYQELRNKLEGV